MKKRSLALALLTALAIAPASTFAGGTTPLTTQGSATATLTVHAHVVRNCVLSAQPLDFGNYDPLVANRSQPLDGTAMVTIQCTKGVSPRLELDLGGNAQGSTRRMSSGADFLAYEIYTDSSRSTVWTAGAPGRSIVMNRSGGTSAMKEVDGRVPAGQNISPGDYDDTITATIVF